MIFEIVVVGQLEVNCYILGCEKTGEGVVIDPGADAERIVRALSRLGLKITRVINTHGHFDHVGGIRGLVEATGAEFLIHEADVPFLSKAVVSASAFGVKSENSPLPDRHLTDGMEIPFGEYRLTVLHTPGHTPGGCSLLCRGMVITGDTLFADSIGRTDLPGGSHAELLKSICAKLLTLPDETIVYPGHGPSTTIGRERTRNPYLKKH